MKRLIGLYAVAFDREAAIGILDNAHRRTTAAGVCDWLTGIHGILLCIRGCL
jgi:hypothetical protein